MFFKDIDCFASLAMTDRGLAMTDRGLAMTDRGLAMTSPFSVVTRRSLKM